jgi:hypothetical protein
MADKDVSIYARAPRAIRDLLNDMAKAKGLGAAQLLRLLVVDAAMRHTGRTICVECGTDVPVVGGTPQWHSHGGRIIGPREDS